MSEAMMGVQMGGRVFALGGSLISRTPATERMRPGSEWYELVVRASLAWPERWAGPPHGIPARWDWGLTAYSLGEALQQYAHLQRVARNLTPEQLAELWGDQSPEAAALRRVLR